MAMHTPAVENLIPDEDHCEKFIGLAIAFTKTIADRYWSYPNVRCFSKDANSPQGIGSLK